MKTRNKVYRVGRLSQRPHWFRQNLRLVVNEKQAEEVQGVFDDLPPEVVQRLGVGVAALILAACLAGLVFGAGIAVLAVL